jgi:hypothetical protein
MVEEGRIKTIQPIPQQLYGPIWVCLFTAGHDSQPTERNMVTAGMNALAMVRFGGFRGGHAGDGFALLLMGLVAVGVLVWALSHGDRNQSAKN